KSLAFFFFNDTATTEIYTLSLHDALPICPTPSDPACRPSGKSPLGIYAAMRSEEHTSELQSHSDLVCRLLLEKKHINHCPDDLGDDTLRDVEFEKMMVQR